MDFNSGCDVTAGVKNAESCIIRDWYHSVLLTTLIDVYYLSLRCELLDIRHVITAMFCASTQCLICVTNNTAICGEQWRRYTRGRQVKWPGWKIHRPGSSPGSTLPSPAFYYDSETALAACVLRATTEIDRQLFWGKKCIWVTWLEDFLTSKWPGSFTALALPAGEFRGLGPDFKNLRKNPKFSV